ncbi:MAG: TMEM198/TM7SF3 family protein [bacterium]|nr:TMEM198/TM7SF3 family protein [bacterium]
MEQLPDISQIPPSTMNVAVAVAIAAGALYCFLGYRALKVVIFLTGFLVAGIVAGGLGAWLGQGHLLVTTIAVAVGGTAGGIALLMLYRVGVFVLGLLGAMLIAEALLSDRSGLGVLVIIGGVGVVGGLLAMALERPVMKLATAALGAWFIVCGVAYFYYGPRFFEALDKPIALGNDRFVLVGCWLVLMVGGVLAQFTSKGGPPASRQGTPNPS